MSLLALCSYWFVLLLTRDERFLDMSYTVQLIGAAVLIFIVAHSRGARRMLERRVILALGTISFSLHLVHDPIVATVDYLGHN